MATALLVCAIGCDQQGRDVSWSGTSLPDGASFEVDAVRYYVHWELINSQKGQILSSFLTLHPHDHSISNGKKCQPYRITFFAALRAGGREIEVNGVNTETLYFVQDKKVVFEKEYEELKIDASQLTADNEAMLAYLQPILENLIRENVKPNDIKE